jgi:hypothetical protein
MYSEHDFIRDNGSEEHHTIAWADKFYGFRVKVIPLLCVAVM